MAYLIITTTLNLPYITPNPFKRNLISPFKGSYRLQFPAGSLWPRRQQALFRIQGWGFRCRDRHSMGSATLFYTSYTHLYMYIHIQYISIYVYMNVYMYVCVYIYTCMHMHRYDIYIYMIYIYTHIYIYDTYTYIYMIHIYTHMLG